MSQPEPFETQNLRDDDAKVIDDFFIETDSPPDLSLLNMPIVVKQLKDPPRVTRMLSSELILDPAAQQTPTQLLTADMNREYLFLRVESSNATATDGIRFSDDQGTVKTGGKVLHGKTLQMDPHTGPIYVWTCGAGANGVASAAVSVSYWAVTS